MRYGLIGWPLGHSISPQLHRRLAGVEYDLRPLPEAEFERFMRERDFSAVNVTIPYKRQVLPYCAQLTPAAQCCGSVNLLIKGRDGTLTGDNTDLAGLEFLLRQNGWVLTGQTVVILGSGGTGHTAKAAAEELGAAEIATVSRTGELNYENLAKRFGKRDFYLINTTPVGMMPQSGVSPLDLRQFPRCKGVADVIYNPLRTRLCQQAAELGIPACGGLLMLAAQAAAAEYAFGTAVPGEETVLRVYRELLAERRNLVFIGMPGSGKTTIGRLAAQMLEREFIDCDEEYLLEYGITPEGELLAHGELYFREREEALLRKLSPKTGCVSPPGAGPSCGRKMWRPCGKTAGCAGCGGRWSCCPPRGGRFPPTCRGCTGSGSRCTGLRRILVWRIPACQRPRRRPRRGGWNRGKPVRRGGPQGKPSAGRLWGAAAGRPYGGGAAGPAGRNRDPAQRKDRAGCGPGFPQKFAEWGKSMKLFIINGPNLDMLGIREPRIYGKESYADLENYLRQSAKELGLEIEIFQSNHEGALIDEVHRAYFEKADGIIINAGGYTHTSVALMDALLAVSLPVIEVHLSDPSRREEFRHRSYVAMAAKGSVVGLGFTGYRRAMELLMALAE